MSQYIMHSHRDYTMWSCVTHKYKIPNSTSPMHMCINGHSVCMTYMHCYQTHIHCISYHQSLKVHTESRKLALHVGQCRRRNQCEGKAGTLHSVTGSSPTTSRGTLRKLILGWDGNLVNGDYMYPNRPRTTYNTFVLQSSLSSSISCWLTHDMCVVGAWPWSSS